MFPLIEIDNFTKKFTDDTLNSTIRIRRNFFQVSEELMELKQQIPQEPFSAGMFLGSNKPLHPSIALLDWVGKRADKFVTVDRKAAWLFLCGRDIFRNSIVKKTVNKGLVIVKNQLGEVIGYGDMDARITGHKIAVANKLDRGDFIRREKR